MYKHDKDCSGMSSFWKILRIVMPQVLRPLCPLSCLWLLRKHKQKEVGGLNSNSKQDYCGFESLKIKNHMQSIKASSNDLIIYSAINCCQRSLNAIAVYLGIVYIVLQLSIRCTFNSTLCNLK
jgi:hypothetical protein